MKILFRMHSQQQEEDSALTEPHPHMRIWRHVTGTLLMIIMGVSGLISAQGYGAVEKNIPEQGQDEEQDAESRTVTPPAILRIPSIGVSATIEHVGLMESGQMENPTTWETVAWYRNGPKPGEHGSAVIAGHLDSNTAQAVFWNIHTLTPGDEIEVIDMFGIEHTFFVTRIETYPVVEAPMQELFRTTGSPQLVLVTCDGEWRGIRGYEKRLVVYASPL